jgi:putative colanic acid biosynthesis glycosyltransferase
MKILQINTNVNSGSVGRIAEDIGNVLIANGHQSFIAYARGNRPSKSKLIKIGNYFDVYWHVLKTKLFDKHGFGSYYATKKLIKEIEKINPDVIGLHNLHGYYININVLFDFLNSKQYPIVWTLFDCWAFTGHCTYFDDINCSKWETQCLKCPKYGKYPSAWVDNSKENFQVKRKLFAKNKNLHIVVHSQWLADLVGKSFLHDIPLHITPSAIDLKIFKPVVSNLRQKFDLGEKIIILGCASVWSERKGLADLIALSKLVNDNFIVVVIGVNKKQINNLPFKMLGVERTESIEQLAEWYSLADVFVNPTYQDNFPTTNIEALACGTPVITYNTGGSPEAIDENTGYVVEKGDINGLKEKILQIIDAGKENYTKKCRERAEKLYNKTERYQDYLQIFHEIAQKKN